MAVPIKIENCPIVDAVTELRFIPSTDPNAVFGIIYNSVKQIFPVVKKLPILQIPEQLRDEDPNLKFKPHYKILDKLYTMQIGPEVLSISPKLPYRGWKEYSKVINNSLSIVSQIGAIQHVTRLGIRYTNFFDINIFKELKLNININEDEIDYESTTLRTMINQGSFMNTLQVSSNVGVNRDGKRVKGSVIDIDTHKIYNEEERFFMVYMDEINAARNIEKELFFSLLRPKFLQSLKPTYK